MLVTFQYPLVDFRPIIEENYKIDLPEWPIPNIETSIKQFGKVIERSRGGIKNFTGENRFCSAKNAFKLPPLDKERIIFPNNFKLLTEGAYRRVQSNGKFMVKCEIGLTNEFELYANKITANPNYIDFILSEYCKMPLRIMDSLGEEKISDMCNSGKDIAKRYLYSTSYNHSHKINRKGIQKNFIEDWWVEAGEPLIIVELRDKNTEITFPQYVRKIPCNKGSGIELFHYWKKVSSNNKISTWVIKYTSEDDLAIVREIRLYLLRINAEKVVLNKIIRFIIQKGKKFLTNEAQKEEMLNYLDKTISKLNRTKSTNEQWSEIADFVLKAEDSINPGDMDTLVELFEGIKKDYRINHVIRSYNATNRLIEIEEVDFKILNDQLAILITELKKLSQTEDNQEELVEVCEVKKAAEENDKERMIHHLKRAGKWVLNVAENIGVEIVTSLLKKQMGLP